MYLLDACLRSSNEGSGAVSDAQSHTTHEAHNDDDASFIIDKGHFARSRSCQGGEARLLAQLSPSLVTKCKLRFKTSSHSITKVVLSGFCVALLPLTLRSRSACSVRQHWSQHCITHTPSPPFKQLIRKTSMFLMSRGHRIADLKPLKCFFEVLGCQAQA